ncbi:MAG TPA: response regulator transcription factor [Acidimicrobiales bacterium]|nr:response regulator transcription factor [Acidimicrobiales bacterium]
MRILVVEDEENLARALATGLGAEGYAVDVAATGPEGLEALRRTDYDLVLLDILLPGLNGFKVCRAIREENVWTPIIMLTAKDGEYDEAEALDTGADDFVSKPFSFVVLVAHIRALLRRGRPERPSVLRAGDLTLDPAEHRCRRGDAEIDLTPREFALLHYLMRFAGEVVSKGDLLVHVWGDRFEGDPNIAEVYVGYLRRKIDVPFGRASLETVRGVGYRLAAGG